MPRLYKLDESTALYRRFPVYCVDATDGLTPEVGESGLYPQISKNFGPWVNTSGALEITGSGAYYVELHETELDTLGNFGIRYKSDNTAEYNMDGQVVSYDPYDSTRLGITALPNANAAANGGLPTVDANNYIAGLQGSINTLDSLNVSVSGRIDSETAKVIASGTAAWLTATGFSTHTANNVRDAILSDSQPFDGANINAPIYDVMTSGDTRWRTATGFSTLTQADILSDATPFAGGNIDEKISVPRVALSGIIETSRDTILASGIEWKTATGFSTLTQADILSDATPFAGGNVDEKISVPRVALSGILENARDTVLASGVEWKTATGFSTLGVSDIWSDSVKPSGARLHANLDQKISTTQGNIVASGDAWTTADLSSLNDPASSAIADAVWDEARSGHTTQGTYGESFSSIVSGAATSTTLTTTQMSTDLTETDDDHYNGRIIIWITGPLANQATDITDYEGSSRTLHFTAVTEAPQNGNEFIIV